MSGRLKVKKRHFHGDALGEAVESLTEMLRSGPRLASDISSEMGKLGISQATIRRAKMKLGVQSLKLSGGHFEWQLPGKTTD
jgi:hypothetical protein